MSQHHTQRSMNSTLEKIKEMIIELGGLQWIDREYGIAHFQYLIAGRLGCSPRKAREYIDIVRRSSIAEARLQEITKKRKAQT